MLCGKLEAIPKKSEWILGSFKIMFYVRNGLLYFRTFFLCPIIEPLNFCQNCLVSDWEKFGRHVSRVQTTKIDFKKMVVVQGQEDSWASLVSNVTPLLLTVTQFEFQKIASASLESLIASMSNNSFSQLSGQFIFERIFVVKVPVSKFVLLL